MDDLRMELTDRLMKLEIEFSALNDLLSMVAGHALHEGTLCGINYLYDRLIADLRDLREGLSGKAA